MGARRPEPATGEATILFSERRDGASHIRLLKRVVEVFPSERLLLVEDNLIIHKSRDVKTALLAQPEIQILPRDASRLNLIEPLWKQLKALDLTGGDSKPLRNSKPCSSRCWAYSNVHRRPHQWISDVMPKTILDGYGSILVPNTA